MTQMCTPIQTTGHSSSSSTHPGQSPGLLSWPLQSLRGTPLSWRLRSANAMPCYSSSSHFLLSPSLLLTSQAVCLLMTRVPGRSYFHKPMRRGWLARATVCVGGQLSLSLPLLGSLLSPPVSTCGEVTASSCDRPMISKATSSQGLNIEFFPGDKAQRKAQKRVNKPHA